MKFSTEKKDNYMNIRIALKGKDNMTKAHEIPKNMMDRCLLFRKAGKRDDPGKSMHSVLANWPRGGLSFIRPEHIDGSLYPVPARIKRFFSLQGAVKLIERYWGGIALSEFLVSSPLRPGLIGDIGGNRFGFFGLFTEDQKKPRLQSLFALLPAKSGQGDKNIPLIALHYKAPWNENRPIKREEDFAWMVPHRGIDLAALVHAIGISFAAGNIFKEDEEVVGMCVQPPWTDLQSDLEVFGLKYALGKDTTMKIEIEGKDLGGGHVIAGAAMALTIEYQILIEQILRDEIN